MLSDELNTAVSIPKAAALFPRKPHPTTVWRWVSHGIRGIKLESWMIGGQRCTTPAAIERFLCRLNPGVTAHGSNVSSRRVQDAGKALESIGC